jgi:hypothetical protein
LPVVPDPAPRVCTAGHSCMDAPTAGVKVFGGVALWSSTNRASLSKHAAGFVGGGAIIGYAAGALASLVVWSVPDLQLGRLPIVLRRLDVFSVALAPLTTSAWVIGAAQGALLLFCEGSTRLRV